MAQENNRGTLGRCWVGREGTFCGSYTTIAAFPIAETLKHNLMHETVPVKTLNVRPFDVRPRIRTFKSGEASFDYMLQPEQGILNTAATVPTGSSEPPLWVVLTSLLGGCSVFAGTDVASSANATTITVTTGHGGRAPAGQLLLVTDPTDGLVPVVVRARATDTLTIWPELTATAGVGADVINMPTWFVSRQNIQSLALRVALSDDTDYQWEYKGGTGSVELKFDRAALATASVNLKFATGSGPADKSYSVDHAADTMEAPLAVVNAMAYIQAQGATTRVNYPLESFSVKFADTQEHQTTLTGGTEGKIGVVRTKGLQDEFATIEFTCVSDRAWDTAFTADTYFDVMFHVPVDVSGGRRNIVVHAGKCLVQSKPVYENGDLGLVKSKVTMVAFLDNQCTGTLDNEPLARTPVRFGIA